MSFSLDGVDTRAATPSDLDEIVSLIHRGDRSYMQWAPNWAPPPVARLRDGWSDRLGGSAWTRVAVSPTRRVVGVAGWERQRQDGDGPPASGEAHLSSLYVDPGCWRRGIATLLLGLAEEGMRHAGYHRARLVTPEGAAARRFYERRGWRQDDVRFRHPSLELMMVGYTRALAAEARCDRESHGG